MRLFISLLFALFISPAFAQSTAQQVVTGYLTSVGCPTGYTTCFVQYGSSGGGGGGTVIQGAQGSSLAPWFVGVEDPFANPIGSNCPSGLSPLCALYITPVDTSGNLLSFSATSLVNGADPCFASAKLTADFESTSSGGSIVTGVSGKRIYLCSISLVTSAAANVSLDEGTGSSVCTGGTTAGVYLNTGTTAANGASFAANGGVIAGSGNGVVAQTANAANNLCVIFSTTNTPTVNVHVAYVQQ